MRTAYPASVASGITMFKTPGVNAEIKNKNKDFFYGFFYSTHIHIVIVH